MSVKRNTAQAHKWNIADTITSVRMVAAFFLLFLPLGSAAFFAVYTLCGLTDAADGFAARKTGTAGEFGARLDSVADLLFYGIFLLRFFPSVYRTLPMGIWYAVAGILLVRLAAYGTAAVKYKRFSALHTRLNKLTGAAVFLLPYILALPIGVGYAIAVCILAFAASAEELLLHLCGKGYPADRASVFQKAIGGKHPLPSRQEEKKHTPS